MNMVVHQSGNKQEMIRFIDYFFMCGLSDKAELYKVHKDGTVLVSGLHNKLVSSVLCHFPKNLQDNPWNAAELWKLCTPLGLSVYIGESKPSTKPRFHSFLITREDGSKTYGHVLTFYELCVDSVRKKEISDLLQVDALTPERNLYIEKCIGFITQLPLLNTCEKVLRSLFRLFMQEISTSTSGNNLPIESYIYNLLYEVPLLSPGGSLKLSCMGHEDPVIVHQPPMSDLPLLDVNLSDVIRLLGGTRNLMNLLTSLLFEHQILLVSQDCRRLAVVAEGITALLFPFQWQHTQVSVLPYDLACLFFDAPVPYLIGVAVTPGEKQLVRQALEVNQCYVDLDSAIVESPEDQPCFPNHKEIISQIECFLGNYRNEVKLLTKDQILSPRANGNIPAGSANPTSVESNEAISRITDIAMKAGVIDAVDEVATLHGNAGGSGKIGVKLQICPEAPNEFSWLEVTRFMLRLGHLRLTVPVGRRVLYEQKFNISVRETMTSAFLQIFLQYEKFIIPPILDDNGLYTFSTETQDNFDKTSFLSDQPETRLPFLLPFLDTQMFATFIDNSIISHQSSTDAEVTKEPYLRLFDDRIIELSKAPLDSPHPTSPGPLCQPPLRSVSVSSNPTTSPYCETWIKEAETSVEKRLSRVDYVSCLPHPVHMSLDADTSGIVIMNVPGTFPIIREDLLESEGFGSKKRHLRRMDVSRAGFRRQASLRDAKWKKIEEARSHLLRQPSMSEYNLETIARTNWLFVEKLLKDVKNKTKKILVGKMGNEAIELGHGELRDIASNLEEKTWIASLCDLLERVWSHGLLTNYKKGKSALWSHLLQYQHEEEEKRRKKQMLHHFGGSTPSLMSQEELNDETLSSQSFNRNSSYHSLPRSFERKRAVANPSPKKLVGIRQSSTESPTHSGQSHIPPLCCSILSTMGRIQSMKEIQTEVGRSRAWIRLALEQKKLHSYLKELFRHHYLLDRMYKKYSLLQCEDEREQFLYHLLSLEAADFNCFTISFPKTTIEYKVWIVPGRQFPGPSQTSANVYMWICGENCRTEPIAVPKGCLEFSFKYKNLGLVTTLTIGHDNAGLFPKWLLDYVVVQSQVTGQTYLFPCHRSLGKAVDDGSIERLLVAEVVPHGENVTRFANTITQQMARSSAQAEIPELQEKVGQAVNNIVKYFHKPDREHRLYLSPPPAAFSKLIFHLVEALHRVFTHGLKRGGFFKRQLYALDVIAASFNSFRNNLNKTDDTLRSASFSSPSTNNVAAGGDWFLGSRRSSAIAAGLGQRSREPFDSRKDVNGVTKSDNCLEKERSAFARLCQLYQQISSYSSTPQKLGKDDIFQLLICVGIHEHSLALWLPKISHIARNESNLYDDAAFLCDESAVTFLCQVVNMLVEYEIPLDPSFLRGHDRIVKF